MSYIVVLRNCDQFVGFVTFLDGPLRTMDTIGKPVAILVKERKSVFDTPPSDRCCPTPNFTPYNCVTQT